MKLLCLVLLCFFISTAKANQNANEKSHDGELVSRLKFENVEDATINDHKEDQKEDLENDDNNDNDNDNDDENEEENEEEDNTDNDNDDDEIKDRQLQNADPDHPLKVQKDPRVERLLVRGGENCLEVSPCYWFPSTSNLPSRSTCV
eukprot:TCONS_00039601-protein